MILTFKQYLNEMASSMVYHATSLISLGKILKTNSIKLTTDIGQSSEERFRGKKKNYYYLSTTRLKYGGYHFGEDMASAVMKLNGEKLNQRYSAKSVDYWGRNTTIAFRQKDDEAEDRIYSPKPTIEQFNKYIEEIHILFNIERMKEFEKFAKNRTELLSTFIELKKSGIPYWIYSDNHDWILQNKSKAKTELDDVINFLKTYTKTKANSGRDYNSSYDSDAFQSILSLLKKKNTEELTSKESSYLYNAGSLRNFNEIKSSSDKEHMDYFINRAVKSSGIETLFHNNKKSEGKLRDYMDEIIRIMRKNKWRTFADMFYALGEKWGYSYDK